MTRPIHTALVLAAALALFGGCAGRAPRADVAGESELGEDEVLVLVQNGYVGVVDVYATSRGVIDRLGTVGIGSPQTFRVSLRQFPAGAPIQIVAAPTIGGGRATSGPLSVRGGTVIEFSISPTLQGSVLLR